MLYDLRAVGLERRAEATSVVVDCAELAGLALRHHFRVLLKFVDAATFSAFKAQFVRGTPVFRCYVLLL